MKVFIAQSSQQYVSMFANAGFTVISDIEQADIVCFTGGEDVDPSFYNEAQHPYAGINPTRDAVEARIYRFCISKNIPMVGICRGGQFLNVMSGGKMYQHVTQHIGSHMITDTETGDSVYATSTHHQMMRGSKDSILVAYAELGGTKEHMGENGIICCQDPDELDTEVLWYESTKCLCFQPHPEFYGVQYDPLKNYFFSLIKRFITKE